MRKILIVLICALSVMFVMTSVYAGDAYKKTGKTEQMSSNSVKASELIGSDVQNIKGEDLGEINDLAIDPQNQRVSFAILSHGGVMDIGDKLIPVPLNAFTFSKDKVILDIEKDRLATAPTIDMDNWEDMATRQRMENSYKFFGVSPHWESETTPGTMQRDQQGSEKMDKYKESGMEKGKGMMENTQDKEKSKSY